MTKKAFGLILLFFMFLLTSTYVGAQEGKTRKNKVVSSFEDFEKFDRPSPIYLRSAGIAVGYYNPNFDFWNRQTIWMLSGSIMPSVAAEFKWFQFFHTSIEIGYFISTRSLTRNVLWGTEELSVEMIPVTLEATIPFSLFQRDRVLFLLGGGVSLTTVSNLYTSPASDQKATGSTTLPFATLSGEYLLGRYVIGLEGRYQFGSYTHSVRLDPVSELITTDVDVSGPYLGLLVKYLF